MNYTIKKLKSPFDMEHTFYMIVRAVVAAYVLYRLYIVVYKKQLYGVWEYLPALREYPLQREQQKKSEKEKPRPIVKVESSPSVIGKTTVVYLDAPATATVTPTFTVQLETTGYMGEEEDVSPDEVESELTPPSEKVLAKDEYYERLDENAPGEDPEFSTGLTYQQLSQAVDVLSSPSLENKKDEEVMEVARTLYAIRGTDMFQFFASQVGNMAMVEQILEECLDGDGQPLSKRKKKTLQEYMHFNMNHFV